MKKFLISLIIAIGALALAIAGCAAEDTDENMLKAYESAYSKVSEATLIEQDVEIAAGKLIVYTREKTYEKSGSVYSVTVKEKRLNDLSAETAYTETEESGESEAGDFAGKLKFAEDSFEKLEVKGGKLIAQVKDGKESEVIADVNLEDVKDMKLELTLASGKLTGIKISYLRAKDNTSDYVCTLNFAFTY